jgi:hypothetical protein
MPLQDIFDFFNSVFFTSITGALAGALGGAVAAQRIADSGKAKDELLREIRVTNAATIVAFSIANTLISSKKQQLKPLKFEYDEQKVAAEKAMLEQQSRPVVFEFRPNFSTLPTLDLPLPILQAHIFEKLSLQGRPILITTTLAQTIVALLALALC